ncbi:MAG: hypothetical protein ACTH05_08145 [Yaniella sp.]
MRNVKYAFLALVTAVVAAAVFLSFGFVSGNSIFYVVALWLFMLTVIGLTLFFLRGYKRVVTRIATANERLAGLKFLQERRYDQLKCRMDYLNDSVRVLHANILEMDNATGTAKNSMALAELDNLNARLQRTERRILGQLENERFANDRRNLRIQKLIEGDER